MIFNKAAFQLAWQKIKQPDDYSTFSLEMLAQTRFFNMLAVFVNSLFFYYNYLNGIKYVFLFFIVFYGYRAYRLERYIRDI